MTWALLLTCLVAAGTGPVRAQETPLQPHRYVLVGAPLQEALDELISASRIELLYDAALLRGKRSRCRITTAVPEEALACMLRGTGLDYVTLSSGVHVVVEGPRTLPILADLVGRVVEAGSGAPVARAAILDQSTGSWTTTDDAGRFLLADLGSGPHALMVRHVAYVPRVDTIWVREAGTLRSDIPIRTRIVQNETVIVSGLEPVFAGGANVVEQASLLDDVRSVAAGALSGADRLVGVRPGFDGTGAHIDGGEPGDNLLMLDGAPVFDPIRNGGVFTSFNPLAVRSLTVLRSGYAAREGSSLSGVIQARHALPSDLERNFVVQASPLVVDGRGAGSLQVKGTHIAWMTAARRSMGRSIRPEGLDTRLHEWSRPDRWLTGRLFDLDPALVDSLSDLLEEQTVVLSSSDFHAASRAELGAGRQLYVSFYFADNRFGSDALDLAPGLLGSVSDEYVWRNRLALLRYSWIAGATALMEVEAFNSRYLMQHPFKQTPLGAPADAGDLDFNEVAANGLILKSTLAPRAGTTIQMEAGFHRTEAEARTLVHPSVPEKRLSSERVVPAVWTWHGMVDSDWRLGRFSLTAGSRMVYVPGRRTLYAEPRASVRMDAEMGAGVRGTGRLSTGLYRQFINQFDVSSWSLSAVLPTFRVWMPMGRAERPPTSLHVALDLTARSDRGLSLDFRAFHRRQLRLVGLNRTADEEITQEGEGAARGMSVSIRVERGPLAAGVAYAYTEAHQQFVDRFGNRRVPVQWLQPHVIEGSLGGAYGKWNAAIRVEVVAGRAWAFRRAYYDYLTEGPPDTPNFGDPGSDGLPVYGQVDVGLGRFWLVSGGRVEARFDLMNATGRRNVIERRVEEAGRTRDVFGLPRIPVFSVRLEY